MNNILAFGISNPGEVALQIATRVKARRLGKYRFALNALSELDALFAQKQYQSLDDVLNEQSVTRKRGKKNE